MASKVELTLQMWTDERCKKAIPKVKKSKQKVGPPPPQDLLALATNNEVTIVPERVLKTFPYQSVGRLFFNVNGEPYTGSAYVADWKGATNLLFTAAHNLLDDEGGKPCKSTDVIFIPAMKDKNDTSGSNYGRYAATAICWNKKWDPTAGHNDDAYDFGIVQLAPRADGKNVGQEVKPIPIVLDATNTQGKTSWETLGYPNHPDNPDRQMMTQTGTYVGLDKGAVDKVSQGGYGKGGSGSCWLRDGKAEGNGVHVSASISVSSSPYFTPDLINNLSYSP